MSSQNTPIITTDFLVVGAGPAGASLSCYLARYGLKGITISSAPGTADTPRAHLTNLSTLDALRDIGLDDSCYAIGRQGDQLSHYRWCEKMSGEEYLRLQSWGTSDRRKGDYAVASPNPGCLDLPQSELEPLLVTYATTHGWKMRFDTNMISLTRDDEDDGKVTSLVQDTLTGVKYRIVSNFLFGADGGRSVVSHQLGLPMDVKSSGNLSWNVQVKCDLSNLMQYRSGNLHWNLRLRDDDDWMFVMRLLKPYKEWMISATPKDPSRPIPEWTNEQLIAAMRDVAGNPEAEVEIVNISKWRVNEAVAKIYSRENIMCLGDAVHRHPPVNGLGSNTCIGDAFNLAWKVYLVSQGLADRSLLSTYNAERQPVGAEVVRVTNFHLLKHFGVQRILGIKPSGHTLDERLAGVNLLSQDSEEGFAKRQELERMMNDLQNEVHALGLEMGQKYYGAGIYDADEIEPWKPEEEEAQSRIQNYVPTTYPGRRLPHAWLMTSTPSNPVSTQDVAGKGHFCLLTGVAGSKKWKTAAASLSVELGMQIKAISIGRGQDWEDAYFDWSRLRGVEEDGAVLVRPDLFCGWRTTSALTLADADACTKKLREVMRGILGFETDRKMQPWQDRLDGYGKH